MTGLIKAFAMANWPLIPIGIVWGLIEVIKWLT
jgi:hypothetical protein